MLLNSGGAPLFSGPFRLMQRPELVLLTKDGGRGAWLRRSRKEEEEDVRAGVKSEKKDPLSLFIRK